MTLPTRKTNRLRFGRVSLPGATYFVTVCTKARAPILLQARTPGIAREVMQDMHAQGDMELLAATIMPDHVHLLFTLGPRLHVGQIMGKFKTKIRRFGSSRWQWQEDGYERQLRSVESIEDYAFYIFMNPYQAGLCPLTDSWPAWLCPRPSLFCFLTRWGINQSVPEQWLGLRDEIEAKIFVR